MSKIRPRKTHFEDLWNEAETLSDDSESDIINLINELERSEDKAELFGEILFKLSSLSKKHNINAAAALLNSINNAKIDKYG